MIGFEASGFGTKQQHRNSTREDDMPQESKKGTPDEKIASTAKDWRRCDKQAIANKTDRFAQRAEYQARQKLREVVDQAGQP